MLFIFVGFIVHIIFLSSIFDIYFRSPVIHGIKVEENRIFPPAKRLVLAIGDGLRADSFYKCDVENNSASPFLRSIIESRGTWGVSHTRVPTESRPGHVALIAGFYEDPSAIFKGWKDNPVEFDSVFNRSRVTYAWGSPDILPMFSKGSSKGRVHTEMYSAKLQDFSGQNSSATQLNQWVFEKFEAFLASAEHNASLKEALSQDRTVFFLHLLGIDVAGHTDKPHSSEYADNIRDVDRGLGRVEQLLADFYSNDMATAFIYTSDHGMTDWGSHGAGSPSETETPIVAWGAGLSQPLLAKPITTDTVTTPVSWNLRHLKRRDIRQADLAPLMAILIGIPIPVHSVGTLPTDYLSLGERHVAEAIALNAHQLTAQLACKQNAVHAVLLPWLYKPFVLLTGELEVRLKQTISSAIQEQRFATAVDESRHLIALTLEGLEYYQNYYQGFLLTCVTLSFLGWIACLLTKLLPSTHVAKAEKQMKKISISKRTCPVIDLVVLLLFQVVTALIYVQSLPATFYVHCLLPVVLWWSVARNHDLIATALHRASATWPYMLGALALYLVGIELMVMTFHHRWVLSVAVLGLAGWPLVNSRLRAASPILLLTWVTSCVVLAAFPALPVVGTEPNTDIVVGSGALWLTAGMVAALTSASLRAHTRPIWLLLLQLSLLPVTSLNVAMVAASFYAKQGLPLFNQLLAVMLLAVSLLSPLLSSDWLLARLYSISLALAVPSLLLSVGHEALFPLVLTINLFTWLFLESRLVQQSQHTKVMESRFVTELQDVRWLTGEDTRRAFFLLVYNVLSFFGTGNIASVNSFDPSWVRCFLTVFSPFTMTALILFKMMIPFLMVSCTFRAINLLTKARPELLFALVVAFCDAMGLRLLHAVTNRGSWLDIGTSISHYVIAQAMVLFLVVLYSIATVYTAVCLLGRTQQHQSLESQAATVSKTHRE